MKKIAIIGPPGSGKTTIAAGLFYNLKILQKKVEIVPEVIKRKVYQKSQFGKDGFDIQNTLEQQQLEESYEQNEFDYLICEAPLCNGYFYSFFYKKKEEWPVLKKIAKKAMPSYDLVIFLEHTPYANPEEFETFGRKEDKETSLLIQKLIKSHVVKELNYNGPIVRINQGTNILKVLQIILDPQSYPSKK